MRVIFLGTPKFSVKPLEELVKAGFDIVGVVTNIDKINARGNKIVFSEVKQFALDNNLPLFQFASIKKEGVQVLKELDADVMVTASYGQLLSEDILNLTRYGVLNIHASLLPKYRGASPIIHSLLDGEKKTGVTIMKTEIGLDDGDMLKCGEVDIEDDDNQQTLSDKLSTLGAKLIVEVLSNIDGYIKNAQVQDDEKATFCKKIDKSEAFIDFNEDAKTIQNKVRAFYGNPTVYFKCGDMTYKLFECEVVNCDVLDYGIVQSYDKTNGFVISCKKDAIKVKVIQKQNSKMLDVKDFMNGNKFVVGQKLQ